MKRTSAPCACFLAYRSQHRMAWFLFFVCEGWKRGGKLQGGGGGGGGWGRTHLLPALVIRPLTTHHFRDGSPFLLLVLIEIPPIFRRSIRCSLIIHRNILLILSPSCFAACCHHPFPSIAIMFSPLSSVSNSELLYATFVCFPHLF